MNRSMAVVLPAVVALGLFGCLELEIPQTPQRAKVVGQVDTQGRVPAEGRAVALVAESGSRQTQPTDVDGGFAFGDLAPGLYYLELKVPGFAPLIRPSVRALAGQTVDVGVLEPVWLQGTPQAGTVTGVVTIEGGAGSVAGGQVEFILEGVGQTVALAALSQSGRYLERVPPGTYTLRATHPLYVTRTLASVTVAEAATVDLSAQPLVLQLNPATLTGTVLREVDGLEPTAAAGALVTLAESGATTTTDVAGQFRFTGLGPGATTPRVSLAGYHDSARAPAQLAPGGMTNLEPITLLLDRGDLRGEVVTGDGQPIDGAVVSIVGTSAGAQVVADAAMPSRGSFLIRGLAVGSYSARVTKQRYVAATSPQVTVVANVATRLPAPLQLALQQGDFLIDDGDPTSAAGYTRTTAVTLTFSFAQAVRYRASEDASFAGVPFVPFTGATQPFTLTNGQGTHVVYAQFEDAANNTSPTFSASIVVDSVAPTTPAILINGGEGFTRQPNPLALTLTAVEVAAASADTVSGLGAVRVSEVAPVGGSLAAPAQLYARDLPFVPSSLSDGVKTIYAQFLDNAGNASAVVSATIVVDTQDPSMVSLGIARGARASVDGYTDSALVQLTLNANAEPNAGFVSVRVANSTSALARTPYAPLAQAVAWFLDPATQGTKTVYAEFRDAAGNTAPVQSAPIVYDTVAPSPVSLTLTGPAITNSSVVGLAASATDSSGLSTSGFAVSEDPSFQSLLLGPQAVPTGGVSVTISAGDGLKRLFARFRDLAGNEALAQVTVTLDTTAPEGAVEAIGLLADGTASPTISATANVTANVTARGAQGYLLGNDSLAACPASFGSYAAVPATSTGLPVALSSGQGARQVRLCLIDAAGNVAGPFADTLTVDSVPPSGCTLSVAGTLADGVSAAPAGRTARSLVSATVQGCSSDVREFFVSGDAVTCAQGMLATWQALPGATVTQPVLLGRGDGPNQVAGCYRDAARNLAPLPVAALTLDSTPPAALGLVLNGGAATLGIAQLDGGQPVVHVEGSAVGATQWALSETNPTAFGPFAAGTVPFLLGGSGSRVVYGRFRDDLGNLSSVVSASIIVDTAPPSVAGASFRIDSVDGGLFVNSASVTLRMTPPTDGIAQQVTERSPASPCVASDFASTPSSPSATSGVFLLSPGDGPRRVCIRWLDAAGNASAPLSDTRTVDTTRPSQPVMLSLDRVFNPNTTGEAAASWVAIANSVDPLSAGFEVLGGQATQWTPTLTQAPGAGTPGCTTGLCVRAQLRTLVSAESGTPNLIRVRELDQAGNASAEASVSLTTDVVAPRPVALKPGWVDNRSGSGAVFWLPLDGGSPDTVAHLVYYDVVPGFAGDGGTQPPLGYLGTTASQGPSPVRVGPESNVVLSGLLNGGSTFVTVRAVDGAGNLSPTAIDTPQVVLQPNEVSPSLLSAQTILADAGVNPSRLTVEVVGHKAYVFAGFGDGRTGLLPVDLANIDSPLQGGTIGAGVAPTALAPAIVSDGQSFSARSGAMAAEPPYLFTAAGSFFRVWSILNEGTPTLLSTINLASLTGTTQELNAIDVRGPHAFLTSYGGTGTTWLFHINVSSLYDNNAGTGVSAVNVVTALNTGVAAIPGSVLWSRDRLLAAGFQFSAQGFVLSNAFSFASTTLASRFTSGFVWLPVESVRPPLSGNVAPLPDTSGLRFADISAVWSGGSSGVELSRLPTTPAGQIVLAADEIFVGEAAFGGVQLATGADITRPRATGAVRPLESAGRPSGLALYGPYLVQTTDQSSPLGSRLRVYEVATPRGMRLESTYGAFTKRPLVTPGFVLGATGLALDAYADGLQRAVPTPGNCVFDGVAFDDTLVATRYVSFGTNDLRITRLDDYHGRVAVPGTITANSTTFTPTTARWTGIERYGNYLVVASARPTGGAPATSLWLEVYRADGLRSRATGAARSLTLADRVAEFQFDTSGISHTVFNMRLRMTGPYAVVTTNNVSGLSSPFAYLVDLRPMLDDNAATTMSATQVLGRVAAATGDVFTTGARDGVLKGNFLYLAVNLSPNPTGLWVVNAADAFDGNAGTVLDGDDVVARVAQPTADSIDVAGAYAVVTGAGGSSDNSVSAYDISVPTQPRLIGQNPFIRTAATPSCGNDLATSTKLIGSRVYVGASERLDIISLE